MASISTYKSKAGEALHAIQFVGGDKKRRSIRLGQLPAKNVGDIKEKIDLLEVSRRTGQQPNADVAAWLGRIETTLYDTLAAGGLVVARAEKQKGLSLGAWLESYLGQRQALVAAGKIARVTHEKEKHVRDCLVDKFGSEKLLADFNCGDAESFRDYLLTSGSHSVKRCGSEIVIFKRRPLAEATTRKYCSVASKIFRSAMRRELINRNPFDTTAVPKTSIATSHVAYITPEQAAAVMKQLPDNQWRLLFALCRFGGMRISEPRLLRWGDVQWDENRLLVTCKKTARYENHGTRLTPIFPELAELLDKREAEAAEGDLYVLPLLQGRTDASLRKTMFRAIDNAGVPRWRRLWHNLRLSRQNELLEAGFKQKAVCYWLGNSAAIAGKHYEKVTDVDWQRAIAPSCAPPAENVAKTSANSEAH